MSEKEIARQQGQSIILVAVAMVALVLFVAITVDMSNAYRHRRMAQNAADAAALGGAQEMGRQLGLKSPSDRRIAEEVNDYAERNGIADTDGTLANKWNENVEAYYLDNKHNQIAPVGGNSVPKNAVGIRAYTYITAPAFFGGIAGLDGYPLSAKAAVYFQVACTGGWCMLPIAVHDTGFLEATQTAEEGQCFNMWDGAGAGNFGWVNWSLQSSEANGYTYSCTDEALRQWDFEYTLPITLPGDCSADCLDINMDPNYCTRIDPQDINVGDPVGGTTGVKNGDAIRDWLKYYILAETPVKILVYDTTQGNKNKGAEGGCANLDNQGGLRYNVAGFACFYMTGFRLSHGQGATECDLYYVDGEPYLACQECTSETDPQTKITTVSCPNRDESQLRCSPSLAIDYPVDCKDADGNDCEFETGDVNRITGTFVSCFGGAASNCKAVGNMLAPRLDE